MKTFIITTVSAIICLFVGFFAQIFQVEALSEWYPMLIKSVLTPPNIVFPIAWTIIYILMGVSVGLLWRLPADKRSDLLFLFVLQFVLNFLWSILFFYFESPFMGLMDIVILDIAVVVYIVSAFKINRVSAWLMIPYAVWLLLATYLNLYIFIYN